MPLIIKPTEAKQLSAGAVPEGVHGKVKNVGQFRSGKNDNGPWSLQKVVITDGKSDLELMFNNRPEVSNKNSGAEIYVVAQKGDRGLYGLKRKDNEHNGRTTPQVWVYEGADVTFEGGGGDESSSNPPQSSRPHQQAQSRQSAPAPASGGEQPARDPAKLRAAIVRKFRARVAKTSAAWQACFDASVVAVKNVQARHQDVKLGEPSFDTYEKIATTFFVNACWTTKAGDVDGFPLHPFYEYNEDGTKKNAAPDDAEERAAREQQEQERKAAEERKRREEEERKREAESAAPATTDAGDDDVPF